MVDPLGDLKEHRRHRYAKDRVVSYTTPSPATAAPVPALEADLPELTGAPTQEPEGELSDADLELVVGGLVRTWHPGMDGRAAPTR